MSSPGWKALIGKLEDWIQTGQGASARRELRRLVLRDLPRSELASLAGLARRAGLPQLALRMLNPCVRSVANEQEGSAEEKIQYAASLVGVGATEEALAILRGQDATLHPETLLFQAFALFSGWDYEASIPLLRQYVDAPGLSDYARLVGKISLTGALVYERRCPESLLEEIMRETRSTPLTLAYGHALELFAQFHFHQRRWEKCRQALDLAAEVVRGSGTANELFVDKWRAFVSLAEAGPFAASTELDALRGQALARQQWEMLRDCDRFESILRRDRARLLLVYFGSPFSTFRARLLSDFGETEAIPETYRWAPAGAGTRELDLRTGQLAGESAGLKGDQVLYRLLGLLARDFYRPARLASLHFGLYPDEYYNPDSSPKRVHRVIRRLRDWLSRQEIPLAVEEIAHGYRLRFTHAFTLRVPEGELSPWWMTKLVEAGVAEEFSSGEVAKILSLSRRSTTRLLRSAVSDGRLRRLGRGPRTRYRRSA